jgi:hypothetical protein
MFSVKIFDGLELTPWTLALGTAANSAGVQSVAHSSEGQPGIECAFMALAPVGSYANAYRYKMLGADPNKTKFAFSASFLFGSQADADACQALEMDLQQVLMGGRVFNFGWQFDFADSAIRVWDRTKAPQGEWLTAVHGLPRFKPGVWYRIQARGERSQNSILYADISLGTGNGDPIRFTVGITRPMAVLDLPEMLNVALQLDGNIDKDPYRVMIDAVSLMAAE